MKRRSVIAGLGSVLLAPVAVAARASGMAGIDGIVIRGYWRARVSIGAPRIVFGTNGAPPEGVSVTRSGSTVTIVRAASAAGDGPLELRVALSHLRGIATSGNVTLDVVDTSDRAVFMDLAGSGVVRATGAVPLLRVTTSGTVDADVTGLVAAAARVHARQRSRLAVRATETLAIVAVDEAHVTHAGTANVRVTLRGGATVGARVGGRVGGSSRAGGEPKF